MTNLYSQFLMDSPEYVQKCGDLLYETKLKQWKEQNEPSITLNEFLKQGKEKYEQYKDMKQKNNETVLSFSQYICLFAITRINESNDFENKFLFKYAKLFIYNN